MDSGNVLRHTELFRLRVAGAEVKERGFTMSMNAQDKYIPMYCTCPKCTGVQIDTGWRKRKKRHFTRRPRKHRFLAMRPVHQRFGTWLRRRTRLLKRLLTTALSYAIALHGVGVIALVIYSVVQEGTAGVAPVLAQAWDAYFSAWR